MKEAPDLTVTQSMSVSSVHRAAPSQPQDVGSLCCTLGMASLGQYQLIVVLRSAGAGAHGRRPEQGIFGFRLLPEAPPASPGGAHVLIAMVSGGQGWPPLGRVVNDCVAQVLRAAAGLVLCLRAWREHKSWLGPGAALSPIPCPPGSDCPASSSTQIPAQLLCTPPPPDRGMGTPMTVTTCLSLCKGRCQPQNRISGVTEPGQKKIKTRNKRYQ